MNKKNNYIGIGKTKYNSSACLIPDGDMDQMQIWQTERLTRKKDSGDWPHVALVALSEYRHLNDIVEAKIAENRDVETPEFFENFYNEIFPFYDFLFKKNLCQYSRKFNRNITFITHHEAHAYAALAMSPFNKSIIVIMDGAGSRASEFGIPNDSLEECSVYLQNEGVLELIKKRWVDFKKNTIHPNHIFTNSTGYFYEKISEFIFNCSTSAGKTMGLAAFGKPENVSDKIEYLESLNWNNRFTGSSKKDWENSVNLSSWCNIAATAQYELEKDYFELLISLKNKYPDYQNLILAGGCALNCTNNAKILSSGLFNKIYVLPFPGDESIGLGVASKMLYEGNANAWRLIPYNKQKAYWGPRSSVPNKEELLKLLKNRDFKFTICDDINSLALKDLIQGKVIGWFQGRSESGPRALGNRSILVRPDRKGIKEYLNSTIKFREQFRPYGCSIIQEKASEYFEVKEDFDNPFMSYALKVKNNFRDVLKEVSHVDQTSRMQTVRKEQNLLFHDLINRFGNETNLYCLLNTSLNIMGEPIVETMEDALNFFEKTKVDSMFIGQFRITKE